MILDGDEAVVDSSLVLISYMDDIVVDNFVDNSAVMTSSMKECVVDMLHLSDYGTRQSPVLSTQVHTGKRTGE